MLVFKVNSRLNEVKKKFLVLVGVELFSGVILYDYEGG